MLPLKILNFSGEWYLLGLESNEIKKFYLNNIKEPNILSHSTAHTQREVLPLKILNFSGEWYLLGLESNEIKKFYLNNITNIRELGQGKRVSQEILARLENALNAWFSPEKEPFMVRLWIDPIIAKYFKRKKISPNQHLDENADGSLDITLHITSAMEIHLWCDYG